MKKKILFSLMTVVLSLGLMGSSFAWFSDTETSTGNTFTAGTMDLEITSGGGPITFANMAPGDIESGTIVVTNIGSLDGNLYGRTSYVNSDDTVNPVNMDLADKLNVTSWEDPTMGGSPIDPAMTLKQLVGQTHPVTLVGHGGLWMDYGALASMATGTFSMTVEFDELAGNDYQSDGVDVTFEFVLIQAGAASP